MKVCKWFFTVLAVFCACAATATAQDYLYEVQPGQADAKVQNNRIILGNSILTATWSIADGRLRGVSFDSPLATGRFPCLRTCLRLSSTTARPRTPQ